MTPDPALSRCLNEMTSRDPFQPELFCDAMIWVTIILHAKQDILSNYSIKEHMNYMTVAEGTGGGLLCGRCLMGSQHPVEVQCDVQLRWDTGCHSSSLFDVTPGSFRALHKGAFCTLLVDLVCCMWLHSSRLPLDTKNIVLSLPMVLTSTLCARDWCSLCPIFLYISIAFSYTQDGEGRLEAILRNKQYPTPHSALTPSEESPLE